MKVLIVDDFDHPAYRDVPMIKAEQLKYWKKGVYRLITSNIDEALLAINNDVWNGLVVFEDCFKYVGQKFTKPMSKLIIDAKQKNLDFVFMYHCWAWVALDLARRCNAYIIFKAMDTPQSRFNPKDAPYLSALIDEYYNVMADPNEYKNKLFKTNVSG